MVAGALDLTRAMIHINRHLPSTNTALPVLFANQEKLFNVQMPG